MLQKLVQIFILICVIKCKHSSSYPIENLYAILDQTTEYFKHLSNVSELNTANNTLNSINDAINKYMENTTKAILPKSKRERRGLQNNESSENVNVLQNFEKTLSANLSDFQDIAFFSIQDEYQLLWFAATVNSTNILLYQLFDNKAHLVATYPLFDGKRIIVNNCTTGTLIVAQKGINGIVILHLGKNRNGIFDLQFKQEFEVFEVVHMNMWFGMNQLYLGIASKTKTIIYIWAGEYFDKIDTLNFGTRKLLFFQNKSFVHIVVIGSHTKIFRFSVRSNKFIETQKLHYIEDASSFYFKEGHLKESFLVLASNNSTIFYKEMYDRFVPFQKVAPTKHIYALRMENTVLLLSMNEDTVEIYQYNGWRFLKSHRKLSNIRQIHQIHLHDEDVLVTQYQNGEWKFLKPIWTLKKTWKSIQKEVKAWCSEVIQKASQRTIAKIPDVKNSVISNAYISHLRVQNLNNYNTEELIHLTQQYKSTVAKLNSTKSILAQETEGSKHTILYGKKIVVKCKSNCYVRHIITDNKIKPKYNLSEPPIHQTLTLPKLKVNTINNWKCPIPNINVDDISVEESINGILMQDLQEGTLKISGDQEIWGEHVFVNLHASNVSIPLDIATNNTRQKVRMEKVRVKELHLTGHEFLLPLNGSSIVMMGSIIAPKVRMTGLVNLKGGITGKGSEKLAPVKEILTPMTLFNDRFLQNVTFRNLVQAKDIVRADGSSIKEIMENSIPLNSNIPMHLTLSSDKIQWTNVSLWDYSNWITKNSAETIVISGNKFTNNSVTLTDATYATEAPTMRLTIPVCVEEVVTPDIKTSSITIDELVVKNLNVSQVLGAHKLNTTIFDSVSALHDIDFSTKLFTGHVFAKNITVSKILGINVEDLKPQTNEWDADVQYYIKGPLNVPKLVVDNLETPIRFNLDLPIRVGNVIVKGDSNIKKINGINIQSFMDNVLKVDDAISLEHVTFTHGFTSNHIYASHLPLNLSPADAHFNLNSKRISTTLETNAINVPQTFGYFASDVPQTFIVQGSVEFLKEPTVRNINDVNLEQLSKDLWMANQNTVISGNNMNITNMTLAGDVIIHNFANSLNVKLWFDLSNKLLSKTKEQHITVVSSFKDIQVSAISASDNSALQCSDFNLTNMLTNSLKRNTAQTVGAAWHFEELDISDGNWNGKLNGIDLNKDIVRHDVGQNIITGEKIVLNLETKNLRWLNSKFSTLVRNALTKKCKKLSTIKGQKTFSNISLNNLSIKGTIMGRNVEEALLKSRNQTVLGIKKIQGQLNTPSLIIDGTINDVNLTELVNVQMKKLKTHQIIESEFDFRNDLEIFGNVTIDGLYEGTDLKNISDESKLGAVLSRTTEVMELSEDITTALQNRAIYVNKFEAVDENALDITFNTSNTEDVTNLDSICLCEPKNLSLLCNDTKLLNILSNISSSALIMKKLVALDDVAFLVLVSSDFVAIYSYDDIKEELLQKAGLNVFNILQASVEPVDDSLWIVLRLSEQTLILHYQLWGEFEQYILPGSYNFIISKTPNNQHLLMRFDGMWNLGGIFHPEHIFKLPLNGKIKTFAFGADYYVTATTKNSTAVFKARYVGN
ncbi:uncharacterized protein clos [Linepithema humile]|uniref:uncharacterized protein clos n=1 Tax=Linepithema humile TaxID=83485 RepID=UPI00351E5F3B